MSEVNSLFEKASRQKLRFVVVLGGVYSTEDLWDLPLQSSKSASLDSIAIGLNKEIKALGEESFVSSKPVGNTALELKLDIVKHIIEVKQAENEVKAKAAANRAAKDKILNLIAQKQDEELSSKSLEELLKLAEQVGE